LSQSYRRSFEMPEAPPTPDKAAEAAAAIAPYIGGAVLLGFGLAVLRDRWKEQRRADDSPPAIKWSYPILTRMSNRPTLLRRERPLTGGGLVQEDGGM
jgi:hypothetical protein